MPKLCSCTNKKPCTISKCCNKATYISTKSTTFTVRIWKEKLPFSFDPSTPFACSGSLFLLFFSLSLSSPETAWETKEVTCRLASRFYLVHLVPRQKVRRRSLAAETPFWMHLQTLFFSLFLKIWNFRLRQEALGTRLNSEIFVKYKLRVILTRKFLPNINFELFLERDLGMRLAICNFTFFRDF